MTRSTIGSMTRDELEAFIDQMIDARLGNASDSGEANTTRPPRDWNSARLAASLVVWFPPRSGKSSLELLREDRGD